MKIYRLAFAAAVVVLAGAQTSPEAQRIAARIVANDLKADVAFLASDALQGRGTPSPGLDAAAEFVASQFRRAGLEPAADDGYFQTAPYTSVTANPEGLQLTLEAGGRTIAVDKNAMAIAEAAPLDLNKAGVVMLASADALNALTPEQVRGKVLILDSKTARGRIQKTAVLRLEPALAIVLVSNPQTAMRSGPRLYDASVPALPSITVWDEAFRKALADAKPGEATISAKMAAPASTPVKLRNVIGALRGSDPALKDTYLLLTAHYDHLGVRGNGPGDHIYNGANDDASGTASVMEIANALAALPRHPRRTVVFMTLFGEEAGLLGSRYYVAHPVFPLAKTIADINLEHMGRTDDNTGPRVGQVNATGFDYTNLTADLQKAGTELGIKVLKDDKDSDQFYGASDNLPFADAGIPSHTLSVSYIFPDYHQPGDEWQKLDYDNMAKVDRAVALGIEMIADSDSVPQWNTANPKTERFIKARNAAGSR